MTGFDAVLKNLKKATLEMEEEAHEVAKEVAPMMEAYAKQNRKWTDRTAHAKQGLEGKSHYVPKLFVGCRIYHKVDYAEYLERIAGGKYAILEPTRDAFAGQFFDEIAKRIMWRMRK
jgi:hypothetical protein